MTTAADQVAAVARATGPPVGSRAGLPRRPLTRPSRAAEPLRDSHSSATIAITNGAMLR